MFPQRKQRCTLWFSPFETFKVIACKDPDLLIIDLQTLNWIAFAPLVVYWSFDCIFIFTTVEYSSLVSMKQSHHKLQKCGEMFQKNKERLAFCYKISL